MGQVLIEIQIPLWIHVRNASMIRNWPSQFHINCVHTSARHSIPAFLRISVVQVYQLSFANFPHKSRLAGVLRKFPTRGLLNYSIAGGARLRMCVAIGRKLLMFQWKHSAAWTAWCPSSDTDTVEGFTFLWVNMIFYRVTFGLIGAKNWRLQKGSMIIR
jgi:hypothetical protein